MRVRLGQLKLLIKETADLVYRPEINPYDPTGLECPHCHVPMKKNFRKIEDKKTGKMKSTIFFGCSNYKEGCLITFSPGNQKWNGVDGSKALPTSTVAPRALPVAPPPLDRTEIIATLMKKQGHLTQQKAEALVDAVGLEQAASIAGIRRYRRTG